jgi:pantoate--beta-alanine ligase
MMDVQVARTREELSRARDCLTGTVAFVPTMGALHEGHRGLLRMAKGLAEHVVVSIFVNPLQFGPSEDLDRYPRAVEADLAMCAAEGVALAFLPSREVMYPSDPLVTVSAGPIGAGLEGASRPGHFDGVLTVVAKLFGLVKPDVAVFGRKDAQQLALVKRMVADLELGVRIETAPLIRDADGLALSSRNRYLSATERASALALPAALAGAALDAEKGVAAEQIVATARAALAGADGVEVEYVALVDPETFAAVGADAVGRDEPALLVAAIKVGTTRLIDNALIDNVLIDREVIDRVLVDRVLIDNVKVTPAAQAAAVAKG